MMTRCRSVLDGYVNLQLQLPIFYRCISNRKRLVHLESVVPVSKLDIGRAVSGTLVHEEDLAEIHSKEIQFQSQVESLTDRGFLRFQKPYEPPPNVRQRLLTLVNSLTPSLSKAKEKNVMKYRLTDCRLKYDLLSKAFQEFQHCVPNSMLYMIETIGDVDKFYHTPVETSTPYDELFRTKNLPQNLHIQKEPLRFHPETDTMFGGISAFPKSSTIVTGLRAKQKYKGTTAKRSWP